MPLTALPEKSSEFPRMAGEIPKCPGGSGGYIGSPRPPRPSLPRGDGACSLSSLFVIPASAARRESFPSSCNDEERFRTSRNDWIVTETE